MLALIQQYIHIWNNNKIEELYTVFSREASYTDALQNGNAIEILSSSIEETTKAFPDVSFTKLTFIENLPENIFVLEWLMKGTNTGNFYGEKPTNNLIKIAGADIIQIKDKKIVSIRSYYDSSLFSTQLGL